MLFKGENQQCLFEGLIGIFEHVGGVPIRIWFDNASTMVINVLKEGRRDLTDDFLRFQEHYRFEAAFCNKGAGWEKGAVEQKVGYHRRNLLVPIPRVQNLNEFNQHLLEQCDQDGDRDHYRMGKTIQQLHVEDKKALLSLPAVRLDSSKYMEVRTKRLRKIHPEQRPPRILRQPTLCSKTHSDPVNSTPCHRP